MFAGQLLLAGALLGSITRTAPVTISAGIEPDAAQAGQFVGAATPIPTARVTRVGQFHTGQFIVVQSPEPGPAHRLVTGYMPLPYTPPVDGPAISRVPTWHGTGSEEPSPTPVAGAAYVIEPTVVRGIIPRPTARVNRVANDALFHSGAQPSFRLLKRDKRAAIVEFPTWRVVRWAAAGADVRQYRVDVQHRRVTIADTPLARSRVIRIELRLGEATLVDANAEGPRFVGGGVPLPIASIEYRRPNHTGLDAPVVIRLIDVLHRRTTIGEVPQPISAISRFGQWHIAEPVSRFAAAQFRLIRGSSVDLPLWRITRFGLRYIPAEVESVAVGQFHVIVGDHAPLPTSRVSRWTIEHTGTESTPVAPSDKGFLGWSFFE